VLAGVENEAEPKTNPRLLRACGLKTLGGAFNGKAARAIAPNGYFENCVPQSSAACKVLCWKA
jgi:hypothetical protein